LSIYKTIREAISDIPREKITSYLSDSVSGCLKTRKKPVPEGDTRWLQHRCVVHLPTLIAKKIWSHEEIKSCLYGVKNLTALIRENQKLTAFLEAAGIRKVPRPCDIRWYSYTFRLAYDICEHPPSHQFYAARKSKEGGIREPAKRDGYFS